jgi:hypothetical protein
VHPQAPTSTVLQGPIHFIDTDRYLGMTLIHGWLGRLISIRWGRELLRDWGCCILIWTGVVVCPSEKEFCCISCLSFLLWTMHAPSGGPHLSPMSRDCMCFNQSVFALLLVDAGRLVTGNSLGLESAIVCWPHQIGYWEFKLKVGVGNPLFLELVKYADLGRSSESQAKCYWGQQASWGCP